jgi:hypothetical protein
MKRHWCTHRAGVVHPDGQQRWDRAYQLVLDWARAQPADLTRVQARCTEEEGVTYAGGDLCAGLHSPASPDPQH